MFIYFLSYFGDNVNLFNKYFKIIPEKLIKEYKYNNNINDCDIIIILDGLPNNFNIDILKNKKVICFPREPTVSKNYLNKNFMYEYTYNNYFHVFTYPQFIDKNYDFLKKLEYPVKTKLISIVSSAKQSLPGHKKRYNFVKNIKNKEIDIYGYGWNKEKLVNYKGSLSGYHSGNNKKKTKYDALIDYKYTIVIENNNLDNYFTEKITDAMLCWSIPIYYGCPNIAKYFPEDSYYIIDLDDPECNKKIDEIIKRPITQKNIDALKKARELILDKYNIWECIHKIVSE